jgi:hypothetical protein
VVRSLSLSPANLRLGPPRVATKRTKRGKQVDDYSYWFLLTGCCSVL